MVLVWRITHDSPNILPAKLFCYTVVNLSDQIWTNAKFGEKMFDGWLLS